nr:deleted in malignant brain tumors 1 protein-like [Biomphalaria glabrata]
MTQRMANLLVCMISFLVLHLGCCQSVQDTECSNYLTEPSGVIFSPNYPLNYSVLLNCFWSIEVPEDNFVILNFTSIRTECGYDYVTVYDGSGALFPQLGWFCYQPDGIVVRSTSNTMHVTFSSDSVVTDQGFYATYTSMLSHAQCVETLSDLEGSLQSPFYPLNYTNNLLCTWLIQVPEEYILQLRFTKIETECSQDFVYVFDGSDSAAQLMGRYCDTPSEMVLVSTANLLYVVFTSDTAITKRGFYANYTALEKISSCNEVLTNLTGEFTSPYYPMYYPNHADCSWLIEVPVGYFISLSFPYLDTECGPDFIAVYDGSSSSDRLLGTYCNVTGGQRLTLDSSSNSFYITFISNTFFTRKGFEAYYEACEGG